MIIPARYGSSRFAGKPLVPLLGEPMILHVWRRARAAGAEAVWVATDDRHIADVVTAAGGQVVMSDREHATGTDRVAEAAERLGLGPDAIVVNVQGDEPTVPPAWIQTAGAALSAHPEAGLATLATPVTSRDELFSPNAVKVVLNDLGHASYFSRAPIPWVRGWSERAPAGEPLPTEPGFLRHIGMYAYRVKTLQTLTRTPPSRAEVAESLEQLRALSLGIAIHVTVIPGVATHGVDTPDDVARVEALLRQN